MIRFANYGLLICILWYSRVLFALFCRVGFLIIVPEPIIHLIHRFFVHAWKHMSIDTQCDIDMTMPKDLLDNFRGDTPYSSAPFLTLLWRHHCGKAFPPLQ